MAHELPPCFIDERELTADERQALNALIPPGEQTGDSRRDLVAATYVVARRMRQHEDDMVNAGAVFNALYRDVQSWRRVQQLTGISFTTARFWVRRWRDGHEATKSAV